MGGSGDPFQPPPMGAGPNPQTQGGNNVPFQHPPLGPGKTPTPSNQIFPMVPMGNPYPIGGYQFIPQSYLGSYHYPPNKYMLGGGAYGSFGLYTMSFLNHNPFANTQLPFLDTLELPDLSKLTNDPIMHHPS